jgi:hypothetical protein
MARASDPAISQRKRTVAYLANGLLSLYILELLGAANFSSL